MMGAERRSLYFIVPIGLYCSAEWRTLVQNLNLIDWDLNLYNDNDESSGIPANTGLHILAPE